MINKERLFEAVCDPDSRIIESLFVAAEEKLPLSLLTATDTNGWNFLHYLYANEELSESEKINRLSSIKYWISCGCFSGGDLFSEKGKEIFDIIILAFTHDNRLICDFPLRESLPPIRKDATERHIIISDIMCTDGVQLARGHTFWEETTPYITTRDWIDDAFIRSIIRKGDVPALEKFLSKRPEWVKRKDFWFSSQFHNLNNQNLPLKSALGVHGNLLHQAAAAGQLPMIQLLVEKYHLDPKEHDNVRSRSLLHWSTQAQDPFLVKKLAEDYQLDPREKTVFDGHTLLHCSAFNLDVNSIEKFIEWWQLNLEEEDANGETVLHAAAYNVFLPSSLTYFIDILGLNPHKKNLEGWTMMHCIAYGLRYGSGYNSSVRDNFWRIGNYYGLDFNAKTKDGKSVADTFRHPFDELKKEIDRIIKEKPDAQREFEKNKQKLFEKITKTSKISEIALLYYEIYQYYKNGQKNILVKQTKEANIIKNYYLSLSARLNNKEATEKLIKRNFNDENKEKGLAYWSIDTAKNAYQKLGSAEIEQDSIGNSDCLLGQGRYGQVYAARIDRKTKIQAVAIKTIPFSSAGKKTIATELKILENIHSPWIIGFYGKFELNTRLHLILELAICSVDKVFTNIPLSYALQLLVEIVQGLIILHKKGIIHRDLKPQNILIGQDLHARIADFDIAKISTILRNSLGSSSDLKGTFNYTSPEAFEDSPLTQASDMYSFGLLIWSLLKQKMLHESKTEAQILRIRMDANGKERNSLREDINSFSSTVANTLYQCCAPQPEARCSSLQACEQLQQVANIQHPIQEADIMQVIEKIRTDIIPPAQRIFYKNYF